ncbi:MAG: biotin/lipoyl-binding protein [Schleiferiaceae bacterium]|jgi:multidrug efflux pump subunit AcrA (membrane-fusion protein)
MAKTKSSEAFQRLFSLLQWDRKDILRILSFAVLSGAFSLMLPLGVQALVGQLMGGRLSSTWLILTVLVVVSSLFMGLFGLFQMRLSEWVQQRIFVRSATYFMSVMPAAVPEEDQKSWYERVHRFFDTITIQKELPKILVTASAAILQLLFGFLLLMLYDFMFVAVSFLILGIAGIMIRIGFSRGLGYSIDESSEKYRIVDQIENFARARSEVPNSPPPYESVSRLLVGYLRNRRDHFRVVYRMNSIMVGLRLAFTALLLIAGGWLVVDRSVSIGQFVAVEIIFLTILTSLEKLVSSAESLFDMLTSVVKLDKAFWTRDLKPQAFSDFDIEHADIPEELRQICMETRATDQWVRPRRWIVGVSFFVVLSFFLPWTQTVATEGSLVFDDPMDRMMPLAMAEDGRLAAWLVREGDAVKKGDTLALLEETRTEYMDPNVLANTELGRDAKSNAVEGFRQKITALEVQIQQAQAAMPLQIAAAWRKVRADSAKYQAAALEARYTGLQAQRADSLFRWGALSRLEWEQRQTKAQEARSKAEFTEQDWMSSRLNARSKSAEWKEKIAKLQSERAAAAADLASAQDALADAEIKVGGVQRRQGNRALLAPRDGFVVQLSYVAPGASVKKDQPLLYLAPEGAPTVVMAKVEPFDVPLLSVGDSALCALDGWPILQIPGWPRSSVGLFSAKVRYIASQADAEGLFAVVLEPTEKWPANARPGTHVTATLLLNDVPMWFELWRQFNGFPANGPGERNASLAP